MKTKADIIREERQTWLEETHLSADCDWPHGHPCERCRLSDEQERQQLFSQGPTAICVYCGEGLSHRSHGLPNGHVFIPDPSYTGPKMFITEGSQTREVSVAEAQALTLKSLSPFAAAWASAPREQRDYVEQDCARWWFEAGRKAGRASLAEDLLELRRLTAERMVNHD